MVKTVSTLFMVFFDMCLFRRKPQDLPQSLELLFICLITYTFINFLLGLNISDSIRAMQSSFLETFFISIITFVILKVNHHSERWLKSLMAITGTGCVLGLFALPLYIGFFAVDGGNLLRSFILMVYMFLFIWSVAVMGHILRYALETTVGVGVLFALIYIVITSILIGAVVPQTELQ